MPNVLNVLLTGTVSKKSLLAWQTHADAANWPTACLSLLADFQCLLTACMEIVASQLFKLSSFQPIHHIVLL